MTIDRVRHEAPAPRSSGRPEPRQQEEFRDALDVESKESKPAPRPRARRVTAPPVEAQAPTPTLEQPTAPKPQASEAVEPTVSIEAPAPRLARAFGAGSLGVSGRVSQRPAGPPPPPPPTPLEQAIHDLLSQLLPAARPVEPEPEPEPDLLIPDSFAAVVTTATPSAPAAPDEPAPLSPSAPVERAADPTPPESLAPPSHLRLVLGDDPADRVVIAVRLRGEQVSVSLQTSDDSTAAALARNAPVLAESLRVRGVELADLQSSSSSTLPDRERRAPRRDDREPAPTTRNDDDPDFELTA